MDTLATLRSNLHTAEARLLNELRAVRKSLRADAGAKSADKLTLGQKVADAVAATMGSWPFIIIQTGILAVWIVLNITAFIEHWDPYPFILLNLALSFQAAYAAPFIMMAQNRQQDDGAEPPAGHRSQGSRQRSSDQYQGRA